jgi:hypothetical protein
VFDIEFISDEPELQDEGWYGLWGRTTIGDDVEDFLAPLSIWSRADYENHWLEAAVRLVEGAGRSGFFTSAFQFWWAMWRDGREIIVQEEFLTPDRLQRLGPAPDTSHAPYHLLGPHRRTSEGGHAISEWLLRVNDIEEFVARRASS